MHGRRRYTMVKSCGILIQRAEGKIETFSHIQKLGSAALLASHLYNFIALYNQVFK